jgi:SPP1 family predicted phage head-tail adaptor
MYGCDEITLIQVQSEEPGTSGYPVITETQRTVYADRKWTRRSEFYEARKQGVELTHAFELWCADYEGEQELLYEGKRYAVERAYSENGERIRLECYEVR